MNILTKRGSSKKNIYRPTSVGRLKDRNASVGRMKWMNEQSVNKLLRVEVNILSKRGSSKTKNYISVGRRKDKNVSVERVKKLK